MCSAGLVKLRVLVSTDTESPSGATAGENEDTARQRCHRIHEFHEVLLQAGAWPELVLLGFAFCQAVVGRPAHNEHIIDTETCCLDTFQEILDYATRIHQIEHVGA